MLGTAQMLHCSLFLMSLARRRSYDFDRINMNINENNTNRQLKDKS